MQELDQDRKQPGTPHHPTQKEMEPQKEDTGLGETRRSQQWPQPFSTSVPGQMDTVPWLLPRLLAHSFSISWHTLGGQLGLRTGQGGAGEGP